VGGSQNRLYSVRGTSHTHDARFYLITSVHAPDVCYPSIWCILPIQFLVCHFTLLPSHRFRLAENSPPFTRTKAAPTASPKRDSSHSSYPPPPPPPCAFCLAVWSRRSSASLRCSYGRSASSPRSKRIAKRLWRRSARRSSKVPPTRTSSRGGRASPTISNRAQGF
jgi:hypothetical protein